jgi:nucleoid DNA-binding protein
MLMWKRRGFLMKTLDELYSEVGESTGLSVASVRAVVRKLTQCMNDELAAGGSVRLFQFGTFRISERGESYARNMQTGAPMVLPARRRVAFKASKTLRARVNGERAETETETEAADPGTGTARGQSRFREGRVRDGRPACGPFRFLLSAGSAEIWKDRSGREHQGGVKSRQAHAMLCPPRRCPLPCTTGLTTASPAPCGI